MTSKIQSSDTYSEQLTGWAQALAAARHEALQGALAEGTLPLQVQMFTAGNRAKRLDKLQKHLRFLTDAFNDLDQVLLAYFRESPLAAYYTLSTDGERFLDWLEGSRALTPEQQDYVLCQRARHAVEDEGRRNRREHLRFQELWSVAGRLAAELDTNPGLLIYLNPIRAWSRFATPVLLDDEALPPADVLFFAVRNEISTAVLEPHARVLLGELASLSPCHLNDWPRRSTLADQEELGALCRDLAEMGLVAFG
jgi:hypothetical protein